MLFLPLGGADLDSLGLQAWTWTREKPTEWKVEEYGELLLRTQPGHIWAREGARNLLLSPPLPEGESRLVAAQAELHDPSIKCEQAGVLCYLNGDVAFDAWAAHGPGIAEKVRSVYRMRYDYVSGLSRDRVSRD